MLRRNFLLALATVRVARADAIDRMEKAMGKVPSRRYTPPLSIEVVDEAKLDSGLVRRKIRYAAEIGDSCPAYLFLPAKTAEGRAAVCLHQTTKIGKDEPAGLGGKDNLHYALELAQRVWVTVVPDYPGFGDNHTDAYAMGYNSATRKGVLNHMQAVDVLLSLPGVNARRIAAIGHSLGGHNSLFLAAFDKRIQASATSCGFTSFARYYNGDLTGWSHRGYMPWIAQYFNKDPKRMPFDFTDVLKAIAPRAVFINAPLHDSNFDITGVRETVAAVQSEFPKGRLQAVHPDCAHDFPPEVRQQAYEFLEKWTA